VVRGFSTYLNLLRIVAAATVFLTHAAFLDFAGGAIAVPWHAGHKAVVLFFVLSGYVIAWVAYEKEHTLPEFAVSRVARIYSVALPALAVTWAVDLVLFASGHGSSVPMYQVQQPLKYLPLFLTFLGNAWFLNEDAFGNLPFWSLNYEVWYYVAFAAWFYLRGWARVLCLLLAAALTGPRIWLLLPVWALGCAVYRLHRAAGPNRPAARLLFATSLVAGVALAVFNPNELLNPWLDAQTGHWMSAHLRYSQYAAGDLLTASVVAVNLYAARYAGLAFGLLSPAIAIGASFTFTLYLVHFPLMELFGALHLPNAVRFAAVLAGVLLLGQLTERQKVRLRQWLWNRMARFRIPASRLAKS
jgi:peptidoglycan/LPS O-acetylase OafA/YrhL